jgi:predicted adenine nucleotide alpha hydrolase (AANH) superfamily ATPase
MAKSLKILLHTCCSTCTIGPYEQLIDDGHQVIGYFYNPNIHPLIEFRRRLKSMKVLQGRVPVEMVYDEEYGLWEFLKTVDWKGEGRCRDCYSMRLRKTAEKALELGCDCFTTTLLTSQHQKHELVKRIGEECAESVGVEFFYRDWRSLAEYNREKAGGMNLYLQQYCGCVFSEYDRYKDTTRHLYKGPQ